MNNYGFKVSRGKFNRDVKDGAVPTNADGRYDHSVLLAYASTRCEPMEKGNRQSATAASQKLEADARYKQAKADLAELKLAREQGLLMPRDDHERDLAARAVFFRREVENFIHLHGAAMIHASGGNEARLPEIVAWWEEHTAIWMDAWSRERVFVIDDGEADEESAPVEDEE